MKGSAKQRMKVGIGASLWSNLAFGSVQAAVSYIMRHGNTLDFETFKSGRLKVGESITITVTRTE